MWPLIYGKLFKRYRNMLKSIFKTSIEDYFKTILKDNAYNLEKLRKSDRMLGKK